MKYAGWIITFILLLIVIYQQLMISDYKEAIKNYKEAIHNYEETISVYDKVLSQQLD
jgi:hypothetical protein